MTGTMTEKPNDGQTLKLPLFSVSRLRMEIDGDGVTTLVAAKGCPLHCRYCINADVLGDSVASRAVTPEELLAMVKIDDLYFRATNGGITFGGGESLLHAKFIRAFSEIAPSEWRIFAETSLNVPSELLREALPAVDYFIVDIKDMNPDIYRAYTDSDNSLVTENLRILAEAGRCGDVKIRVPRIPSYNTDEDRCSSVTAVQAIGPFQTFDFFDYVLR
ncbi:MAG: radical SAM protein [Lachnospiraceae bacterium]|nr:radical SAM protein [Lachnospiraceae bacterium]